MKGKWLTCTLCPESPIYAGESGSVYQTQPNTTSASMRYRYPYVRLNVIVTYKNQTTWSGTSGFDDICDEESHRPQQSSRARHRKPCTGLVALEQPPRKCDSRLDDRHRTGVPLRGERH